MPWVRIDDEFAQHPKLMRVGPLGMALQVAALCYCNKHLTDGFIPWAAARSLLPWEFLGPECKRFRIGVISGMSSEDVAADFVIGLLLEAGLWDETEGGYVIHDYLNYQPSKNEVLAEREQKREAGRKGGLVSAQARAQALTKASANAPAQAKSKPLPLPIPIPDPTPDPPIDTCASGGDAPVDDTTLDSPRDVEAEKVTVSEESSVEAEKVTAAKPRTPFASKKQENLFDQFWRQYPRKKNKGQAERVWEKLLPDKGLFEAIMAGLERARDSPDWRREGGRYVPYPATWLNAKGWEDEYEIMPQAQEVKPGGDRDRYAEYDKVWVDP